MSLDQAESKGRVARRQRHVREALVRSAQVVMSEKGLNGATMLEIAQRADVGAGTVYNYFKSKDELAIAVLERMMHDLAVKIERETANFDDPARVYAHGVRTVLETAIGDERWHQLLSRAEVIADAIYRQFGPFATRDLRQAIEAGRFDTDDPELLWRLSAHAIVGFSLAVTRSEVPASATDAAVVRLLCMAGLDVDAAKELATCKSPALPTVASVESLSIKSRA